MYPKLTNRSDVLEMLDEMLAFRRKMFDSCTGLTVEQLNDPVYPGTWSVLKNLAHLAFAESFMFAHIKSRPAPPPKESLPKEPPYELMAVRTALDEAHAETIAFLKANPESALKEKCVFGRNHTEETVGGLYFHIVEHEIGHRTFVMHKLAKLRQK